MRVVLQRVSRAGVSVAGEEVAAIGPGLLALVGIEDGDDAARAVRLAGKTARLRLFAAPGRPFETSVRDEPGRSVLVVSQFTLAGDVRRGNRPSWTRAAPPDAAAPLVDAYAEALRAEGVSVATGRFGSDMAVSLVNDGPVTLVLDGADLEGPRR
ncbi:MAG: D-aminoacyl-tRNA deacylase [Miltoncostaeaceae bacterium]